MLMKYLFSVIMFFDHIALSINIYIVSLQVLC